MKQFTDIFFAGFGVGAFLALFAVAMIASFYTNLYNAKKRAPYASSGPSYFSRSYFVRHNLQSFFICLFGNFLGVLAISNTLNPQAAVAAAAALGAVTGAGAIYTRVEQKKAK